jgi:type III secretion system FlhB-like substrate exporter
MLRRSKKEDFGVEVMQNAALLQSLSRLPIDGKIGADLFQVVAKLIAHVFALDAQHKGGFRD